MLVCSGRDLLFLVGGPAVRMVNEYADGLGPREHGVTEEARAPAASVPSSTDHASRRRMS